MAEPTFFFYDLETSGRDPRRHRIMQFAGQRTSMDLVPIGPPVNIVVRLDREILPEPAAVLITGITPQYTEEHGIPEREAIARIMQEMCLPQTIIAGFNNVRFDDEFIRFTAYRNFHDAYEWCWQDGRSRWDLLDAVRLVRALRPEGIVWPTNEAGEPVTKLESLAQANGLSLEHAHDALSDVVSLIELAKLLKQRQPKMFQFLLGCRVKDEVARIADPSRPEPFVYASGMYGPANQFTTVAFPVGSGRFKSVIAYDLRLDPATYEHMDAQALKELRFMKREEREAAGLPPFPAKDLQCNKCPAVAPYSVLRDEDALRLGLDKALIAQNVQKLAASHLSQRLVKVFSEERTFPGSDAEGALYDGFIGDGDKRAMVRVRALSVKDLSTAPGFQDARLVTMFARYKARNVPESLTALERQEWEDYCSQKRSTDLAELELALSDLGELDTQKAELLVKVREWAAISPVGKAT
jgi:exodeoxyribonuclease-1